MGDTKLTFKRLEKKFLLSAAQYERLMAELAEHIEPDLFHKSTVCSVYYDNDSFSLIRRSIGAPVYKEKLRVRSYGVPQEDGKVFVELKKKFDGVVYKRRITTGIQNVEPFLSGELPSENFGQIGREIGYFQSFYHTVP